MMPGRTLHRLASRICTRKTLEQIIEPAIADLQKEYLGADAKRTAQRVGVLITGYTSIFRVIAMCALSVATATESDRQAIVRTMWWSFALMMAFTTLLMLPPLSVAEGSLSIIGFGSLIPQALPLAIPTGLTFGIALGMVGRTPARQVTRVILSSALAASLLSFAMLAWMMPAGNQAWRESIAQQAGVTGVLTKGPNEMTFSELDRRAEAAITAGDMTAARSYAWSFHLRFALSTASVVLAGLLCATAIRNAAARALIALLACVAYWALIYVGEGLSVYNPLAPSLAGTIPTIAGAWLPNIVLVAAALLMVSSRSSRLRGQKAADV